MRLRTCNNRRRAQAHHATTRASLKRVWARVVATERRRRKRLGQIATTEQRQEAWRALDRAEGTEPKMYHHEIVAALRAHRRDLLMYGTAAMKDGKRIAPEDLYVEPPRPSATDVWQEHSLGNRRLHADLRSGATIRLAHGPAPVRFRPRLEAIPCTATFERMEYHFRLWRDRNQYEVQGQEPDGETWTRVDGPWLIGEGPYDRASYRPSDT